MAVMQRLAIALLLSFVLAAAVACAAKTPPPQATLDVGTILTGTADTGNNIARWQGVRYAQPPVGKLRFAPPQPIDKATQNSGVAPSKKTPQAHGGAGKHHDNAALSLRPMPFFTDSWHYARGVINGTRPLRKRAASTIAATKPGPKCAQSGDIDEQSEDCLYANVYRPLDAPNNASLPVILFIHGGAFQTGSGSDYDPTLFMKGAVKQGLPVVFVTFNYRLNGFGFFASSDLATLAGLDASGCTGKGSKCSAKDAGSQPVGLNLGFQDMKMAINWTYSNIDSFGGDPSKITIWGQSAGAFGVGAQLVGSPGKPLASGQAQSSSNPPRPLFRAAIFQSGAPSGYALALPSDRDLSWQQTLTNLKCGDAAGGAQGRLNCVRNVPWQVLRNESLALSAAGSFATDGPYVLGGYPWSPVADGGARRGGFFDQAASQILQQGDFAQVPIITGNNLDEGTIFVPHQFTTPTQFERWVREVYFQSPNVTAQDMAYEVISASYPDVPALGSPYSPANGNASDRFWPGENNQYKRCASFYGDMRYHSNRRFLLQQGLESKKTPAAWTYLFQDRPVHAAVDLGVPHSSDLDIAFGFRPSTLNAVVAGQYASFATNLDPNGKGLPVWPKYDTKGKMMLSYNDGERTDTIIDDYREEQMDALNSVLVRAVTNR